MSLLLMFKVWLVTLLGFLVMDFTWIGLIANGFYKAEMGDLLRKNGENLAPLWGPAFLLYVLMVAGLVVFVLPKLTQGAGLLQALAYGAFFGLVLYAVYDLTNYSLMNNWSLKMTIVDMLWGSVLCGLSSVLMLLAYRFLSGGTL